MKNNYKLLIFGDHYSIVSDDNPERITQASSRVDNLMKEIAAKAPQIDEKKIAVLVALQMASKALELEEQLEDIAAQHTRLENDCIALLRRSL